MIVGGVFGLPNLIFASDLNFTLNGTEFWGKSDIMDPLAPFLSQLIKYANLIDMAPSCASPTWKNDRAGEAEISKRLDRFFASSSLLPHIQKHRVWANPSEVSDHYPVCLEWNTKFCVNIYPFKFNRAWLLEEGFSNLVKDYWTADRSPLGDNDISSLVSKLKGLKVEVKLWEKKKRMVIKKNCMRLIQEFKPC